MSSWVVIGKQWNFANFKMLYMYFKCLFNFLSYCFMLFACYTKIIIIIIIITIIISDIYLFNNVVSVARKNALQG